MVTDSINEEILRIKHELAAQHGNDVGRIVAHARLSQGHVVTRPPRPYKSDLRIGWFTDLHSGGVSRGNDP